MRSTVLRDFGGFSEISENSSGAQYTGAPVFNFAIALKHLLLSLEYTVRCPLAHFLLTYRPHKARAIRSFNLEEENAEAVFRGDHHHAPLCNERDGAVGGHEGMRR